MRPYFSLFFLLIYVFIFSSCKTAETPVHKINISEGLAGRVVWREGNFMPTIDDKKNKGISRGVSREILIYELTNVSQASKSGDFFQEIKTKLVTKATSTEDGYFEIPLPPGNYSLLIKETEGLYANIFDGENNIFPVTIDPVKVTELTTIIDYKAAY